MSDVAFDTETTGLNAFEGDVPFMLQAADDKSPSGEFTLLGPAVAWAKQHALAENEQPYAAGAASNGWLKAQMDAAARLAGHNAPFDVHMLHAIGWDLTKPVVNTQTLAQIVAPERRFAAKAGTNPETGEYSESLQGYHLKELAEVYVDPDAKDGEAELERLAEQHGFKLKAKPGQQGYVEAAYYVLWQLEPEAMEFYAREDVRLTRGLLPALERKLTGVGLDQFQEDFAAGNDKTRGTRTIWELEQRLGPIIIEAESKGIRIDGGEKAAALRAQYLHDAEVAHDKLDKELGPDWSQNNDTLAEALLRVGVPLTETTDKGDHLAVNKHALERFEDKHPIIQTLFEYRVGEKFVSTYLDHFVGKEVIHPSFAPIGTWTGRMSSYSPNMQNVPVHAGTAVRELFLPREGMCFVGIDFEQIELRGLGYYLNNADVTKLIEESDYFAHQAARTLLPGMEFYDHRGDEAYFHKGQPGAEWRQINKNGTYAIMYGVGGVKLGKMFGWPPDSVFTENDWVVQKGYKAVGDPRNKKAENFIKLVKNELKGYYHLTKDRVNPVVQRTGAVNTILGRYQWVGYDGAWKALSGLIQGGAADLFKLAVLAAVAAVASYGAYPVLFIHDEIVFECPIDCAAIVVEKASAAMTSIMPTFRPRLAVEANIAYNNWGEAK